MKKVYNGHLYNRSFYLSNFIKYSALNFTLPFNLWTCKSIKFIAHMKKDGLLLGCVKVT